MRIAFVSGNREKLPDAVIPLGLLYVYESVPDFHEKQFWDLCFERYPEKALAQRIASFAPELIALGLRNIQNNDYSGLIDNIEYYASLIASIRNITKAPIVLGGGGFSVMPLELMGRLRPDFGIAGEGERSLPLLVEVLDAAGSEFAGIGNLLWFEGEEMKTNPPAARFLDMNDLRTPDRALVDPRYYKFHGIESVQTKRGCPLRCDYCTYPTIEGRVGRTRLPESIVDEMFQALEKQPGIEHFFIVDSVFNLPKRHAMQVCEELIARGWVVPWTCYANPLGFDAELAHRMARAGCRGMEIGSDSGSNEILKKLKKGFSRDDIRSIHSNAEEAEIMDCHTFILGTPGETLAQVEETLEFIIELDPYGAIIQVWIDDCEALDSELRIERMGFRERVLKILEDRKAEFPRWIIPPLGVNFDAKLLRYLRRCGLSGPLWQHLDRIPRT